MTGLRCIACGADSGTQTSFCDDHDRVDDNSNLLSMLRFLGVEIDGLSPAGWCEWVKIAEEDPLGWRTVRSRMNPGLKERVREVEVRALYPDHDSVPFEWLEAHHQSQLHQG